MGHHHVGILTWSRLASAEAASSLAATNTFSSSWLRRYQCNVIGDRAQIGTDAGAARVDDDVAASRRARQCEDAAGIEIRRAKADCADKRRSVAHRHRVGRDDRAAGGRVRQLRRIRSHRDHSCCWRRWWCHRTGAGDKPVVLPQKPTEISGANIELPTIGHLHQDAHPSGGTIQINVVFTGTPNRRRRPRPGACACDQRWLPSRRTCDLLRQYSSCWRRWWWRRSGASDKPVILPQIPTEISGANIELPTIGYLHQY